MIRDPDAVVAQAMKLLQSQSWDELVVGLAVTTGRRLAEILQVGRLFPETMYSVKFAGQLKRRDKSLDAYEIPTLCQASLVLDAWQRLRQIKDVSSMPQDQISKVLGPVVSETANRYFSELVPVRTGKDDLFTSLFRTVYARIAVLYYGVLHKDDLTFMATIQGHYWFLEAEGQKKIDYAATLHYNDYRIADASGNIDGRQGIKLGLPGVIMLQAFQKNKDADDKVIQKEGLVMSTTNKTGFSTLRPKSQTKAELDAEQKRLKLANNDDLLVELLRRSRLFDQMQQQLAGQSSALGELLQRVDAMGVGDSVEYLNGLVARDERFREGITKRNTGTDYSKMSMKELEGYRTEGAAIERFRRAVEAIKQYNMRVTPLERWYIKPGTVRSLVHGRYAAVVAYLDGVQADIDAHHKQFDPEITPAYNRKPYTIESVISLSDEPEAVEVEQ